MESRSRFFFFTERRPGKRPVYILCEYVSATGPDYATRYVTYDKAVAKRWHKTGQL